VGSNPTPSATPYLNGLGDDDGGGASVAITCGSPQPVLVFVVQ